MQMMKQNSRKQKALAALGLLATGAGVATTQVSTVQAATTNQTAGGFDLTRPATTAPFPVMFDRPSGVNAAALAGAVRTLGANSALYKSALRAVPELSDASQINNLLNHALSDDAGVSKQARGTILKLINWYNGLGGFQIRTQSGATYTASNLDEPINTIVVGFANPEVNRTVSDAVQREFANVRNVGDVMTILDRHKAGTSSGYQNAFNDYVRLVNQPNANIEALSEYAQLRPLLNAYEKMYADGAAQIRSEHLKSTSGAKEVAVAFFESAVITGRVDDSSSGSSGQNDVGQKTLRTRWVDASGNPLAPEETGKTYKDEKSIPGYRLRESRTENGVKTYIYEKLTERTSWVDESGKTLKPEMDGTLPDREGDDIPGYNLVETRTEVNGAHTQTINVYRQKPVVPTKGEDRTRWVDENGNTLKPEASGQHPDTEGDDVDGYTFVETVRQTNPDGSVVVINRYTKTKAALPDTYWIDKSGKTLKPSAKGQTLPDNDGVSDIPGYRLVRTYTVTQNDMEHDLAGSSFKVGDTINIYEKIESPIDNHQPITKWVDEDGNALKDPQEGQFPDNDNISDIPGYHIVRTILHENGDVTNVYQKNPVKTHWVDENGKDIKDPQDGEHPDKEGDDMPGYKFIETKTDENGNIINVYHKIQTHWVDENGKDIKDPQDGEHPDKEGDDVPGYKFIETKTDENGNIINVYQKNTVKTHWVDENGKDIKEPQDGAHPDKEGDDVPGYKFIETKTDENGNIINVYHKIQTHWVDENGKDIKDPQDGEHPDKEGDDMPGYKFIETKTDDKGNIINVYHKIQTHWVDENGKDIKDPQDGEHPDKEGDDVPGYKFIETKTDDKGNIINVYHKIQTRWVDENGKDIKEPQDGEHPDKEGDDVPGYKFIETKTDENGNIINVYHKIQTRWVDENGKDIKEPQDGEHPDKEGDDVPGYKFIETKTDDKGNIINVYHKIQTRWVDENGKDIKEPQDGEHPDKEGDDVPGYKFIETKTDDKGNIINVYRQETKQVTTHWVNKDGVRLADDVTGENFGEPQSFDGYKLVDVRMSKDGTEKFYVYDKVEDAPTPKQLPKTGDGSGVVAALGSLFTGMGGLSLLGRKRKDEE